MLNNKPSVIIMIGFPGSGKSTWINTHYYNFTRIDGDSLKTSKKVTNALYNALSENKNVIVDATNVTLDRRKPLIETAKQFGCKVYAVVIIVPVNICISRLKEREEKGGSHVPKIAVYKSNKNYIEPSIQEGFDQIVTINNV